MSVNLQVRSSYTLLSSTIKIEQLIKKCVDDNIESVSMVDKNVMHSAIQFYNACIANHIKPIIGLEIEAEYKTKLYGYVIIAINNDGYAKLIKLSTKINTKSDTIKVTDLDTLADDCVIILTTTLNLIKDKQELIIYLKEHKQLTNMYCGLNSNDLEFNRNQNKILKEVCKELDIKTVAISPTYYLNNEDSDAYETCIAIKKGMKLNNQQLDIEKNRHFRNEEEMKTLYDEEDLETTEEIAKLCNYSLPLKKAELPVYKNKLNIGSEEYLNKLCKKGLIKRLKNEEPNHTYITRLNYELQIINQMKFADYFLIVYDFIRYARSNNIYVGPGRGSAAGSLVAYCLGITHVDPIKYNLLFERFLNPERISMPDIDTDFPDNRREEVIEYVRNTYGEANVAHIVTFGTFGAKQVIRDVGKAIGLSSYEVDKLAQAIPNLVKVNLMYAYNNSKAFKILIDGNERNQQLLKIALKLEGLPRHASTHAGGIIISRYAIDNYCPLISVEEGIVSTQYPMEYLENLGLIKMDFLGLRNLTIIDEIVTKIKKEKADFDIMNIPLDDFKTYELIQNTNTVGVFQLESDGMKNLIHKMKPNCFEDIVATIALYRPGPMENIPTFLEARNNKNKIEYLHPKLKEILEPTYGVIIYQEQIMQIAQVMGGFSLGKADILRKAISKKKSNQVEALKKDFINGALKLNYTEELANQVYELIMKFANYGFNKSHSVAYALICYQMAYLKANNSTLFFVSLLNSVIVNDNKTVEYILEARMIGIKILGPDINFSTNKYEIENNNIRCPLTLIKGLAKNTVVSIMKEKEENGTYKDFYTAVSRLYKYEVKDKTLEAMINAGVFDLIHNNRATLIASCKEALKLANLVNGNENQISFDLAGGRHELINVNENKKQRVMIEKEYLGFYLGEHPIFTLRKNYNDVKSIIETKNKRGYAKILGQIDRIKQHRTKKGDVMAFISVSDDTSNFDLVIMPDLFARKHKILIKGKYILATGRIEKENSCLVKEISEILEGNN